MGGASQIDAELELLRAAVPKHYDYYHLISGMDFPLKSQDEIHNFFELNSEKEFIHFGSNSDARLRCQFYWLFQERIGNVVGASILRKICNKLRNISIGIQKILNINRIKKYGEYENISIGSTWFSITDDLASFVLSQKSRIQKCYKNTFCCDEVFLQTIVINSSFYNQLYSKKVDDYHANMRYIDWVRGKPYVWRSMDYDELINSEYLFARKFDERVDSEIIDKIYKVLK